MPCCPSPTPRQTESKSTLESPARNQLPRQRVGGEFVVRDQLPARHIPTDNSPGCQVTVMIPLNRVNRTLAGSGGSSCTAAGGATSRPWRGPVRHRVSPGPGGSCSRSGPHRGRKVTRLSRKAARTSAMSVKAVIKAATVRHEVRPLPSRLRRWYRTQNHRAILGVPRPWGAVASTQKRSRP